MTQHIALIKSYSLLSIDKAVDRLNSNDDDIKKKYELKLKDVRFQLMSINNSLNLNIHR